MTHQSCLGAPSACHPWGGHLQCGGHEGEPSHGEDAAGRHAAGSADEEVQKMVPMSSKSLMHCEDLSEHVETIKIA